ncbi:hypothetical protein PHLCEN_2v2405 [Hermanssonia centrifuga]|uniref:Calcineurin-like phosphoesterase domain-containing protein n=1 Tax=Hermanssonia centrifuga TaxID=98765 RepID=A0A2R6RM14_9APHY|nr:hypothetical protein PHLCEN_2v2405 [Hermanssonia centrifuga]
MAEQHTPTSSSPNMDANATSQVYVSYDPKSPPKHPGPAWTRFICISDTHSERFDVPPGEVLLHAGDLSSWGRRRQLKSTMNWLRTLPHPVKIVVAGNHDLCLDKQWADGGYWYKKSGGGFSSKEAAAARALVCGDAARKAGIFYLEHQPLKFTTPTGRSWEVYGSPAAPQYVVGAFQYSSTKEAEAVYAKMPPTTEILLTHTPPYGICDVTKKGSHAGCPTLACTMESNNLDRCRLHIFGHIHEARGALVRAASGQREYERVSVNAAIPNRGLAIIVDLLN